jgi:Zn-dependent protease/predicted transcriptional regulator
VAGTLGLLVSIIFHELAHSLVARRLGLPMKGITLFIFGGVAEMEKQPESPRVEFLVAIAGPLSSVVLSLVFYGSYRMAMINDWAPSILVVFYYLGYLNLLLAGFNMIPAFPLDGGRVLRAALWRWKRDLRWATRIGSRIGKGFGAGFIILGVVNVLLGNFIGGMWWALIGFFLRRAAGASYEQLVVKQMLEGEPVSRFMSTSLVTVPPSTTLRSLVEDYVYRYQYKMFPVVEDSRLVGCITTRDIRETPRDEWDRHTVLEVANQCSEENTVSPNLDAASAMSLMAHDGKSRLMVVENGRLLGIVALRDMMKFLSIKMDLEQMAH